MAKRRAAKICIVTQEFSGLVETSDSAATVTGLAEHLASLGDAVTVLFVPPVGERRSYRKSEFKNAQDYYRDRFLIELIELEKSDDQFYHPYSSPQSSLAIYYHFKNHEYDIGYFSLNDGLAYYTLLAKELGAYEEGPQIITLARQPLAWRREAEKFFLRNVGDLTSNFLEEHQIEHSDRVVVSSRSLLSWFDKQNWKLPEHAQLLPDLFPSIYSEFEAPNNSPRSVDEIVLFGESDYKSGFTVFCDFVEKLSRAATAIKKVTLLGRFDRVLGEHTGSQLLRRARDWPFEISLLVRQSPAEALNYLKSRNCLVVCPTAMADAPVNLQLCLLEGIPVLASDIPGNRELVRSEDAEKKILCPLSAEAFAKRITRLDKVSMGPSEALNKMAERKAAWTSYHSDCLVNTIGKQSKDSDLAAKPSNIVHKPKPLVSIITAHFDRPTLLQQAVESVRRQDYPNIELIVIDDGSRQESSLAALDDLEPEFQERGWQILREENRYLGAARNTGIRKSKGEFILFLDDDNILFDHAVSSLVAAMESADVDVCTCMSKLLYERIYPKNAELGHIHYYPLGGCLDLAMIHNPFGDANAMMRRTVFEKIGYLIEDYGYASQDWEFFTRAALADLKTRIYPEPLYWYRSNAEGMYRTSHWVTNRVPIFNAFKRHQFKGLKYYFDLAMAQHADSSEKDGYHHNLYFSPSDNVLMKLADMPVDSDEALTLLADFAAAEGRANTSVSLLSQRWWRDDQEDPIDTVVNGIAARRAFERLNAPPLVRETVLTTTEMAEFTLLSVPELGAPPHVFVDNLGDLCIQARQNGMTAAVLASGCPAGTTSVSSRISLDEIEEGSVECLIMVLDTGLDVLGEMEKGRTFDCEKALTSGWQRITANYENRVLRLDFQPFDEARNLVLAVKPLDADRSVVGKFSEVTIRGTVAENYVRRPRRAEPVTGQKARFVEHSLVEKTWLYTQYESEFPLLETSQGEQGFLLRPNEKGPVVACISWGFPPLARSLTASVEIAHHEAFPFEFSLALVEPKAHVEWTEDGPSPSIAFSGWKLVYQKQELKEIEVNVSRLMRRHLDIHCAIRLPSGSYPQPSQSWWRKFIVRWIN